ncbi:MAG: UPF0175 family protein [Chitinophagales bacterium]|nr:UPF0175 family protein [Chitinophagales bacterium]
MKKPTIALTENVNEAEVKMAVAAVLFERGFFSSGQAADFADITKREFLENVGKYGVSIFGETEDDLKMK